MRQLNIFSGAPIYSIFCIFIISDRANSDLLLNLQRDFL